MPQLDANTFTYQYFGIIFILFTAYTLLSYIALPALLRVIIVRDLFLKISKSSLNLTNLLSNRVINTSILVDPFVSIFSFKISKLINFFLNKLSVTNSFLTSIFSKNISKNISFNTTTISINLYILYLSLFFSLEDSNNNE